MKRSHTHLRSRSKRQKRRAGAPFYSRRLRFEPLEERRLLSITAIVPGFNSDTLAANDDDSTDQINLPFTINFFGSNFDHLWVNNNGNVTFNEALEDYTPFGLETNIGTPIIAPFFSDVDTRGIGSGVVTYGTGTIDGHAAFGVNYRNVGYFREHTDKLNSFQVLIVDRSDRGTSPNGDDFDIEFNYDQIQWETGDLDDGSNGFGGTSAAAGFSNGTGDPNTFFQIDGSLRNGALLDTNATTGLIHNSLNSTTPGRYVFHVSNGTPIVPVVPTPEPITPIEGASFTSVVARFSDPNGAGPLGNYSADIDWGDGSPLDTGTIGPGFTVTGTHTYLEERNNNHPRSSPYNISVKVHKSLAPDASVVSTAVVSDPAVVLHGTSVQSVAGQLFSDVVATFTDPGGVEALSDYSATIDWGDGSPVDTGTIGPGFTVSGIHTYGSSKSTPYSITITVHHESAPDAVITSSATVTISVSAPPTTETQPPTTPQPPVTPEVHTVPDPTQTPTPTLVAIAFELPQSDGGAGGDESGLPPPPPPPPPPPVRILYPTQAALQAALSQPRRVQPEDLIDKVYALGDFELVSLVGIDMGDEPLMREARKPVIPTPTKTSDTQPIPDPVPVPIPQSNSWALWSALAGGAMWLSGAWWWRVHRKRGRVTK